MPHRFLAAAGLAKLAIGSVGTVATAWGLWLLAELEPDHLRLLMVAAFGACLWLIRAAFKDFSTVWVPSYATSRKLLKQMDLDMREMERKFRESEAKVGEVTVKAEDNSALIARMKADLDAARSEAQELREKGAAYERYATERRHTIDGQVQRQAFEIDLLKLDLQKAYDRITRLKARLGMTDQTHAQAINTVSDSVEMIAVHLDPPLPEPVRLPHLEPTPLDPNGSDVVVSPKLPDGPAVAAPRSPNPPAP